MTRAKRPAARKRRAKKTTRAKKKDSEAVDVVTAYARDVVAGKLPAARRQAQACERHLQQLPTTVEEDEALVAELQQRVAAGQAREQALLAVQWRAGHKRVVRRALQVAQQWFGQLRRSL
jgi:hypothetical protein